MIVMFFYLFCQKGDTTPNCYVFLVWSICFGQDYTNVLQNSNPIVPLGAPLKHVLPLPPQYVQKLTDHILLYGLVVN